MAIRPSRSARALVVHAWVILLIPALIVSVLGCGRDDRPPVVAEPERAQSAQLTPPLIEPDLEGDPINVPASGDAPLSREHRSSPGKKLVKDGDGTNGSGQLSKNLLTGENTSQPRPPQGGGFNGQAGQLFQGGGGALGFGGGGFGGGFGGGNFGMVGGRNSPRVYFDPGIPPDGFNPDMTAEQYQRFVDNPFKRVKGDDALSTISTTVDTASYSNVRARINEGQLPAKDAVRIADFVNYFPYDYIAHKNGEPVAFKLEMAPCPWNAKHHLLRVGLKAKVIDKEQLPARNLVFLVDTSGSMNSPNRLPLVQESLKLLVEQLTDRDRVSIFSYAATRDCGLLRRLATRRT